MKALQILATMCMHPRVKPYQAKELASICKVSLATTYYALSQLRKAGLVEHVQNGFIVSQVILSAGALYQQQLARMSVQTLMEELYVTKNSKAIKH